MPNNVYNRLIIKGESNKLEQFYIKNRIEENIDTEEKEELLCFSNLVPIINQDNWYEERIQKWSTKWEPYDITINENYDNNILEYEFYTAWSPPHEWLLTISKIFLIDGTNPNPPFPCALNFNAKLALISDSIFVLVSEASFPI